MLKKEKFQLYIHDAPGEEISTHTEVELFFILEGSLNIQVEQKLTHLKTEDILVVNSSKKHVMKPDGNPLIMRLLIDYLMICDTFQGQDVVFWCDSTGSENERYRELRVLLKRMLKHYVEADNYTQSFGFQADCYAVLNQLTAHFMVKAADIQGSEDGDRYEERLSQINHYINSNYDQPISMKELSEKLFLSNGYLSRFFKKNYGMSFANYLTNVRLLHAVDELLYTDIPVTRVAYDCGFTSAALFNKVFKKSYGLTPTEYRRKANNRQKPETAEVKDQTAVDRRIEQKVREETLEQLQEMDSERSQTVEGSFSVAESFEYQEFWGDTINFGSASNLLHSSMREHLMILQRALNFKYVRFWSIFSRDFYILPEQETYDFSQIDSVLDFVQEQGMKPFIELGMKPNTIHYEVGYSKSRYEEEFTQEQWKRLIRSFMRHLSTRYGQHMLDEWRMELWFDESLRQDENNWKDYFQRFDDTWEAVKECNEQILLGGYGIRMDYGGEERERFLKLWTQRRYRPDFISIMHYDYERGEDGKDIYARRSTDNENFIHNVKREKEHLKNAGMEDLPIFICEWNLTPSVRNYMNDTTFKGAYIVKNIIDLFGEVQSMGYGAGSDRQYASYDTPQMLFGGTGLITKEAVLKPAAFALDFMNRMFPYLITREKNYLVTTDRHNNYSIVCHNQQILNYNYFLTSETAIEKEGIWKYFDEPKRLHLHLHLKDIKEGQYRVKVYRISNRYGSVLDIWETMGYDNELSRNDIKYLRRICEPNLTIRKADTVKDHLILNEELAPNEICLIRVRYIG